MCGRSLFITYGDAWVAKFNAQSGKHLSTYRYRQSLPAGEIACAEGSVFLPLTSEGTIVRLTQAKLRFETRIAIGLRTSTPVFADGMLFASDRAQNRVIQVELERNAVIDAFDVPEDPAELGTTPDGIAILFERNATVGVLTPSTGAVRELGRVKAEKRVRLATVGELVLAASRDSRVITVFDEATRDCGRLDPRPAQGFTSIAGGADGRHFEAVDPSGRVVTFDVADAERALAKGAPCR